MISQTSLSYLYTCVRSLPRQSTWFFGLWSFQFLLHQLINQMHVWTSVNYAFHPQGEQIQHCVNLTYTAPKMQFEFVTVNCRCGDALFHLQGTLGRFQWDGRGGWVLMWIFFPGRRWIITVKSTACPRLSPLWSQEIHKLYGWLRLNLSKCFPNPALTRKSILLIKIQTELMRTISPWNG